MSQAPAAFSNAYPESHDHQRLPSFPLLALGVSRLFVLVLHLAKLDAWGLSRERWQSREQKALTRYCSYGLKSIHGEKSTRL